MDCQCMLKRLVESYRVGYTSKSTVVVISFPRCQGLLRLTDDFRAPSGLSMELCLLTELIHHLKNLLFTA